MNIDNLFVNKLLSSNKQDFRIALKKVPVKLITGIEQDVYKFARRYHKETKGSIPSLSAVEAKFPDFVIDKAPDDIIWYCNEIKERAEYMVLSEGNSKVQNKLIARDVEGAIEEFKKIKIGLNDVTKDDVSTSLSGLHSRIAEYKKAKKNKGIIGLQTGIVAIDKHLGGITNEQITLVGRPGLGKTFFALFVANNLLPQLKKPLTFVSNEMADKAIFKRMDAIMGHFSASRYRKGQLTEEEEERLFNLEHVIKNLHDFFTVINGAGKSADDIEYELLALEPEFLIVDGLYLTNMGTGDPFKDTLHASRAYQRISKKYRLPILQTTQFNAQGEKIENLGYSKAIRQDSDIVFKIYRTPAMEADQIMGLEFLKIREEETNLKALLNWKFDTWDFSEISADSDSIEGEPEEYSY